MTGTHKNTVLTYGLTEEENKRLTERHTDFAFADVSDCFTDLLALPSLAMIINPEKLSQNELELLAEVHQYSYMLSIFTGEVARIDLPCGFFHEICDISDETEMADKLKSALLLMM